MWGRLLAGEEATRVGVFKEGVHPLVLADLRTIVESLDRLGYPDNCPVEVKTPLPPRDRRAVGFKVHDYTPPQEGNTE